MSAGHGGLRRRGLLVFGGLAATLGLLPSGASAITLGQLTPGADPHAECFGGKDFVQGPVAAGNPYTVPDDVPTGTITSWSHAVPARFTSPPPVGLKVFRKTAALNTYMAIAHDGPFPVTQGVNQFKSNVPGIQAGDTIGVFAASGSVNPYACEFVTGNDTDGDLFNGRLLADGDSSAFIGPSSSVRVNISAVLQPTSAKCAGVRATVVGSSDDDELFGSPGRDVIAALGGDDTASGLSGKDLVCGGSGDDLLKGGAGKDTLRGERGDDKHNGGKGKDECEGAKGDSARRCEVKDLV